MHLCRIAVSAIKMSRKTSSSFFKKVYDVGSWDILIHTFLGFRTINPTLSVEHLSLTISSFQVCFWMTSSVNQNALNWPGNLANVGKIMHKVVFGFLRIENAFYSFDRFLKCPYIKCRKTKFANFIVCYFLWEMARYYFFMKLNDTTHSSLKHFEIYF